MKITMNSWKWHNGTEHKDFEFYLQTDDKEELVIRKSDNMEQVLRVPYNEFRRAVNALKEK